MTSRRVGADGLGDAPMTEPRFAHTMPSPQDCAAMKPPNLHEERSLLSAEQLARWRGLPVGWYTVAPATFTRHDGHALPLLAMIDSGHARAELGFSTHTEYKDLGAGAIGLFSGRVEGRYSRWNCRSVRRIMLSLSADALAGAGMLSEELIEAPWAQDTEFYDPEVTAVLRCMVREIAAGSPNGRLYAQSLSMGLVLHLSRNRRAQGRLARERGRLSTDQQRRLRDFIHADLAADLSLLTLDVDKAERRSLIADTGTMIGDHCTEWSGAFMQQPDLPSYSKEHHTPCAQRDPLKDAGRT